MDQPPTLLVRRLPAILSSTETEDLLRHFGSQNVYVFPPKGPMRNCATATFHTHEAAVQAMHRLHQLEVFGRRLLVEFAHTIKYSTQQIDNVKVEEHPPLSKSLEEQEQPVGSTQSVQDGTDDSKETTSQQQQLCYLYPPPSPAIVGNIAHVLSCVPSFYEQVLHLMNKMNLPAPFCQPPMFSLDPNQWGQWQQQQGSDDSELESDEEHSPKESQPKARREAKRRKVSFRQVKEAGPVAKKPLVEQEENPLAKKIVLNVPQELSRDDTKDDTLSAADTSGGFGLIEPVVQPVEIQADGALQEEQPDKFIGADELKKNRLSKNDLSSHPAFRNYSRGDPTTRLYIKNLAKNVTEQDLTSIYGRYIDYSSEVHIAMFNVRLMTSGRMKGQAFIGLPSEEIALQAITDTNGYQLKGKPIVVQFARSAKAT